MAYAPCPHAQTRWVSWSKSGVLCTALVSGFLFSHSAKAETDLVVEDLVADVSQARVTSYVQTLQDFGTRYTFAQGNIDARDWLFDFFLGLGLEVELHEFTYANQTFANVIARIPGTVAPDEIVAISGHFDSVSQQSATNAPGADDDASAIAAVLESALLMSGQSFDRTIEFMCYNVEEQGRRGSQAIAVDYIAQGKNLVGVINADMIGYWPTGWDRDLDVAYEPVSEWLADHVVSAANRYVGIPISKHLSGVCRDDHVSFTDRGLSAVTNMDCWEAHNGNQNGETTPHYHRTTDTIDTLNLPCMTQAIQVSVAALAELAGPNATTNAPDVAISAQDSGLHNRPNPFASMTEIRFEVVDSSEPFALRIYDARGRHVRSLVDAVMNEGEGLVRWDGRDSTGGRLPDGVYFCRLESRNGVVEDSQRVILLR